jgi:hypothetical protein
MNVLRGIREEASHPRHTDSKLVMWRNSFALILIELSAFFWLGLEQSMELTRVGWLGQLDYVDIEMRVGAWYTNERSSRITEKLLATLHFHDVWSWMTFDP